MNFSKYPAYLLYNVYAVYSAPSLTMLCLNYDPTFIIFMRTLDPTTPGHVDVVVLVVKWHYNYT